jgi:hypothetical protein
MEVLRTVRLACAIAVLGASTAVGQTSFHEGFEGPEPILEPAGGDVPYRIAAQQIVRQSPHSGVGSEVLKIAAENGQSVYFSVDIGNGLVIADLAPSVWLKADRPGLQVFLRAVLPRTRHPQTGQPLTTLIPGTGYTQTGQWQQLRIERIDQLFERQVRALRAEHGKHLDPTGAFVDRLVLNVYAGPGATTVWIDDVDIAGLIHPQSVSSGVPIRQISSQPIGSGVGERLPASWTGSNRQAEGAHRSIQVSGASLMVDQTPLFPRIIEHQGESLSFLRSLGFNGVLLAGQPSAELLREASAAGMWLIAQPPSLEELQQQPNAEIGAQYASVLAWHLGSRLGAREAEHIRTWAKLIKRADTATRPIIATPDDELRTYSRSVDALIASRESLGTTLDLWDYYAWERRCGLLCPAKCRPSGVNK